jgi:hypothetical protein
MKKILLTVTLAAMASLAIAQQTTVIIVEEDVVLTTKRGTPILPTAGNWSFSVDASPFLRYAGNIFGAAATAPTFNNPASAFDGSAMLSGKYFMTDSRALRARLVFAHESGSIITHVPDADGNDDYKNVKTERETNIQLWLGMQNAIGTGSRLVGYYGAEAGLMYSAGREVNKWGDDKNDPGRHLKTTWSGFGIGAGVFTGVEYFVAPRISVGGEIGWGIECGFAGRGKTKTQTADGDETHKGMFSGRGFGFGTRPNASLTLSFYF